MNQINLKHNPIEIDDDNPFGNCKLEREEYAKVLTNIINSYPNGFVLSINNKWGTGKTTFIKMWDKYLQKREFKTLYFNAWENDFENNALTALMGELKSISNKETKFEFKKALKNASTLSKHITPIIIKAIAEKFIDTKGIQEAIVDITDGLSEMFETEVHEYEKKKIGITDFRRSLAEFIANTNNGKPLIFFIDELDRCRPDYAVSILEQVKHFFNVPKIVFVLSIDKCQLGHAIKGVYGSDNIDSDEYLRRFIDLEYSIPEPEAEKYYKYLYDFFNFDDFFMLDERSSSYDLRGDKSIFLETCKILFSESRVQLRQQEKIFAQSRLALRSFQRNMYVNPHIFLFLSYIKIRHNDFYLSLKSKLYSIEELQNKIKSVLKIDINEDTIRKIMYLEVSIINTYHKHLKGEYSEEKLYEWDNTKNRNKANLNSIFKEESENDVMQILETLERTRGSGNLPLSHYTNRLDFLEELED